MKSEKSVTHKEKTVTLPKQFPFEFEAQKRRDYHPSKLENFKGDILEIGPGRGDLLLAMATENPDKKYVAIELGKKRFFRLIPRIEKKKLTNILLIRGDARVVLSEDFKKESFETILVLFPDPWPKKRHAFRRLLTVEFLTLLSCYLKTGGHFITGTDVEPYACWTAENLAQVATLKNDLTPQHFVEHLPELKITYFEEKWRKEGKRIFFMKYRKIKLELGAVEQIVNGNLPEQNLSGTTEYKPETRL